MFMCCGYIHTHGYLPDTHVSPNPAVDRLSSDSQQRSWYHMSCIMSFRGHDEIAMRRDSWIGYREFESLRSDHMRTYPEQRTLRTDPKHEDL